MAYYVGIDVLLKESSVCVVDSQGKIIREAKAACEPAATRGLISALGPPIVRIGMEAGPLSQWLREGSGPGVREGAEHYYARARNRDAQVFAKFGK